MIFFLWLCSYWKVKDLITRNTIIAYLLFHRNLSLFIILVIVKIDSRLKRQSSI